MKRNILLFSVLLGCLVAVPSLASVSAGETITIRMASLAPAGSSWDKIFQAWNNSVREKTNQGVKFQFFPGGVAGDEKDVIRKMKVGQMDAAGLTSIGLGQIARPVTLLQMPGLFKNYEQLGRVRKEMAPEFEKMFADEGYRLVGWGDAGFGRVFSKKPILKPSDYKAVRPWVPREDPSFPEFMKIVGANGVPLGIPEVFPALQTGMVDTVVASAIAAVALQWFRYVTHMSKDTSIAIVGATLVREEMFKKMPPDHQKVLLETGKQAHEILIKQVMLEDNKAYKTLLSRGMIEFDPLATPAQAAEWEKANTELLKRLTGRLWTPELMQKVKAVAAGAPVAAAAGGAAKSK